MTIVLRQIGDRVKVADTVEARLKGLAGRKGVVAGIADTHPFGGYIYTVHVGPGAETITVPGFLLETNTEL